MIKFGVSLRKTQRSYLLILKVLTTILCMFTFVGCSSKKPYNYVDTTSPKKQNSSNTPTSPTKKSARITPNYSRYIVRRNDTLSSISRRSGISVNDITRFNQLKSERLEIGQTIFLPGVYELKPNGSQSSPTRATQTSNNIHVIPRTSWANYKIKKNVRPMGSVNKITVHHTDGLSGLSKMTDLQFIRSIENYHRNNKKWACIGYHFIIGRDGNIYEGRPLKYQGAHASANNSHNVGISLVGNFDNQLPAKKQLKSLQDLLYKLRQQFRIPSTRVYGHTHLGQTECPGKFLKHWIEVYRTKR